MRRTKPALQGRPNHRQADTQTMVSAADAGQRAETRRHQHGKGPQEQVHQPQQPLAQGEEHEEGARGIPETRLRPRLTVQAGGELPQLEAEVVHRPLTRPELLDRLAPAGISRRPRGQRAEARQRNSAGHSGCTDGWVGGLQNDGTSHSGGGPAQMMWNLEPVKLVKPQAITGPSHTTATADM